MYRDAELTNLIIEAAIEVHRILGPGLLESVYEVCLCYELEKRGLLFERQKQLPVSYKGVMLDCGYRIDLIINETVVLELKSVDVLLPIHEAQLLTYLKLTGLRTGLLLNFNSCLLKDGIKRMVL